MKSSSHVHRFPAGRTLIVCAVVALGSAMGYADGNLLLWDGEAAGSNLCSYGTLSTSNVFRGAACFEGTPDAYHPSSVRLDTLPSFRCDLSSYDEIWFFAKCSAEGKTFDFSIYGWPNTTNSVNIDPYIDGGKLTTTYKRVRIPISVLKTADFPVNRVEALFFGLAKPTAGHKIYIDDVWAVRLSTVNPDASPLLGNLPSLNYGDVAVGSSKTLNVSVANIGTALLAVSQISFSDGTPSEVTASPSQFTVPAGGAQTVTFTFAPGVPGDKSITAILTHTNTVFGSSATIPISAKATGSSVVLSNTSLEFGTTTANQAISWPLTITNAGNLALEIGQWSTTGAFSVPEDTIQIAPGESSQVLVTYHPTSAGDSSGQLAFHTNDVMQPELSVLLSGQAADATSGTAQLPVRIESATSSKVALKFPAVVGASEVRVYVAPEPAADLADDLPGQYCVAKGLAGSTTDFTVEHLAAAVDVFLRIEARNAAGVITAGSVHARTVGGPKAPLDTDAAPVRDVHMFAPNILEISTMDFKVTSYAGSTGSVAGDTGEEWHNGPWTVAHGDGTALAVQKVYRHSVAAGAPYYVLGKNLNMHPELIDIEHKLYLVLNGNVRSPEVLHVTGPRGLDLVLPFSDKYLETPAIQLNQVGYSPRSARRYAYVSGWMGKDLTGAAGPLPLTGYPASAEMLIENDDPMTLRSSVDSDTNQALPGLTIADRAAMDSDTGADVKEIDLAAIPAKEGRVYRVRIPGVGVSWPTQISNGAVFKAFWTIVRGLYYDRWGRDLRPDCTDWSGRPIDHPKVYKAEMTLPDKQGQPFPFFPSTTPKDESTAIMLSGGHHDAGDYDLQTPHYSTAMHLMEAYELNPGAFADGQLDLPEKDNGIPDILDEALYEIREYVQLQEPDGGIRAGVESYAHPTFSFADEDTLPYWTYSVDLSHTARCAALMAWASRVLTGLDAGSHASEVQALATSLRNKAILAYSFAIAPDVTTTDRSKVSVETEGPMFLASSQLYYLTGDAKYKNDFERTRDRWNYDGRGSIILHDRLPDIPVGTQQSMACAESVLGYVMNPNVSHSSWYYTGIVTRIQGLADTQCSLIDTAHAHRNPRPINQGGGWGSASAVGQYLPSVYARLALRGQLPLAEKNKYVDALSLSADYVLGGNPHGMVWITGLGTRSPLDPLDNESMAWVSVGKDIYPGLAVFGPSDGYYHLDYYEYGAHIMFPAYEEQPIMRRYCDLRTWVVNTEGLPAMNAIHALMLSMLLDGSAPAMPPEPTEAENESAKFLGLGDTYKYRVYEHDPLPPRAAADSEASALRAGKVTAPAYVATTSVAVSYSGADGGPEGLKAVYLWAKGSGGWEKVGSATGASGSFTYTAPAEGTYYLATQAEDNAGNLTAAPSSTSGCASTIVDLTAPVAGALQAPVASKAGPIAVAYTGASDAGSGVLEVRLWVKKGKTGAWANTGLKSTPSSGSGSFSYSDVGQEGPYYFYAQAVDKAGQKSPDPTDAIVFVGGTP